MRPSRYITAGVFRSGLPLVILLFGVTGLKAQLTKLFRTQVVVNGETYMMTFDQTYKGSGLEEGAGGVLRLPQAGRVFVQISGLKVSGPDPVVADAIDAQVVFPAALGGQTAFLTDGKSRFKSTLVHIEGSRNLVASTMVQVYYQNAREKSVPIDLGRRFEVVPAAAALTPNKEPAVVTVTKEPKTTTPVAPERPKERPAHEVDFEELSPKAFVKKWSGKTEYVNRALAEIPLEPKVKETEDKLYTFEFDYVRAVTLDTVTGGTGFQRLQEEAIPPFGYRIVVKINDLGKYRLHFFDSTKVPNIATAAVDLDNLLGGSITQAGDSIVFRIQGGTPPYQLLFLLGDRTIPGHDLKGDTLWSTSIPELRELAGGPGTYGFQVIDQQRSVTWDFDGTTLVLPKKVKPPSNPLLPLLAGGGVVLLGLLLLFRRSRKNRRRSRIKEQLAEDSAAIGQTMPAPAAAPKVAENGTLKKPSRPAIASSVHREVPREISTPPTEGFRVTRRAKIDRSGSPFNPDVRAHDFLPLALKRNWREGRVSTILFSKQAIHKLDDFLRRENTSKIAGSGAAPKEGGWERNEAIPEIGGMLMGQFQLEPDDQTYRVSVEEFIPLEARVQNVVKVEIDPLSLARDLSKAQDDHPDMIVVGWFHTHPGHGLFLSQPDLKVQHGHFREPYNFAMEIDSLTENLDTAFFTYLPDGQMNNRNTRLPNSEWFSWSEIEKFTRRNSFK